jgi:hypothetical protein
MPLDVDSTTLSRLTVQSNALVLGKNGNDALVLEMPYKRSRRWHEDTLVGAYSSAADSSRFTSGGGLGDGYRVRRVIYASRSSCKSMS